MVHSIEAYCSGLLSKHNGFMRFLFSLLSNFMFAHRPIRLAQCCTQFKSPGDKILCVWHLHYNVAFTFK